MNPDLYRQAVDLFDRLQDVAAEELPARLESACEGRAELRAEVLRLLAADTQARSGGFLENRAVEDAARLLPPETTTVPAAGTVIGNYRLEAQIGAGGMGVVFEGRDLRLDRRLAIKILPVSGGAEDRLQISRFQREARAASKLNHPNIVAIFDADFAQGYHYIAMEFVEGRTLRRILQDPSAQPDRHTILDWLGQTAAALDAAHQAGIVHRDIKPENIIIRPDGFVKVLDFGLAKLREPPRPAGGASELRTRPGILPGTIHYLAPEQILGEPASPRSDLFSLGVVSYELATGVRPFDGPTDGAVFHAILNCVPPAPSAVRAAAGTQLDALVMRALEKDPALRFQTAEELRSACRRTSRNSMVSTPEKESAPVVSPAAAPVALPAGRRRSWWLPAGALAAISLALVLWLVRPQPPARVSRVLQITSDGRGKDRFVNDGTRLYYAAGTDDPASQMFQVSTKGGEPVAMPRLQGMFPLDISPDQTEMVLAQELPGTANGPYPLWVAPTVGNALRRLGDLRAIDAHWSPKGDEIAFTTESELRIARGDGSASRRLAVVQGSPRSPVWSPDGRTIRFTLQARNLETLWETADDGRPPHPLLPDWGNWPQRNGVWTLDGNYFIFSALRTTRDLWALPQAGRIWGAAAVPVRLTNGPLLADRPQTSPDHHRLFFVGALSRGELVRYDPKVREWLPYLGGPAAVQLDYSRDGRSVVYASHPDGAVWRSAIDGSQRTQLTAPPLFAVNPCWSPDGAWIAFFGGPPSQPTRIYAVPARGGAIEQLSHGEMGPNGDADASWSPDSKELVFGAHASDPQANLELSVIDWKSRRIRKLPGTQRLWSPRWSPDGAYIAALDTPVFKLCLYHVRTRARRELTTMGVGWPTWSRDSRFIYFEDNRTTAWFRVRVGDGKVERLASLSSLKFAPRSLGWVGLSPDGYLISTRDAGSSEIYALDWEGP